MITYTILTDDQELAKITDINSVAAFLYLHLGQYRDDEQDISKSIEHAMGRTGVAGGFLVIATEAARIIGAVVMNRTGMSGFIPENILVYVAVHAEYRGKGIGSKLVETALKNASGDVKLHVEYDNPAKQLYEKIGFTSKYAEMRYTKGN